MPLYIELIKPYAHDHESLMWKSLSEGLQKTFVDDGKSHFLLGNFSCEKQIDALYIGPRGICIIELKSHYGMIHAPQNGPWYGGENGTSMIMDEENPGYNPFDQVQEQKNRILGRIKTRATDAFTNREKPRLNYINGRVVFNTPIEFQDLLDHSAKLWFAITDLNKAPREVKDLAIETFRMSERQIRRAREAVVGDAPPVFTKKILHVNESDFLESQRTLSRRQGDAQNALKTITQWIQQMKRGEDPFNGLEHEERHEIAGLRKYPVSQDHYLVVLHLHDKNYLAFAGNNEAAFF